jgi:hypothetical protein
VFSDTLDIRESYALGSLATVFQTEVYAVFVCSDCCRSANIHNMTICICSDSKAALLALSSYTISSKLLQQCWLSLQDLSNNNRVRLFWVPGHENELGLPLLYSIIFEFVPVSFKNNCKYPKWFTKDLINLLNTKDGAQDALKNSRNAQSESDFDSACRAFQQLHRSLYNGYVERISSEILSNPSAFWSSRNGFTSNRAFQFGYFP